MSPRKAHELGAEPYRDAADLIWESGIGDPVPIPFRKKENPPKGYTGKDAPRLDKTDVEGLVAEHPRSNVGVRLAEGHFGLDIDSYKAEGEASLKSIPTA